MAFDRNIKTAPVFTTGMATEACPGISQQTVIREFDNGRLKGFRVPGSRFRRIPRENLLKWMKENDLPTDALEAARERVGMLIHEKLVEALNEVIPDEGPEFVQFESSFELGGELRTNTDLNNVVLDERVLSAEEMAAIMKFIGEQTGETGRKIHSIGVLNHGSEANGFSEQHNVGLMGDEHVAQQIVGHYSQTT